MLPEDDRRDAATTGRRSPASSPEYGVDLEEAANRLQKIVHDQGKSNGPLELPELAESTLREAAARDRRSPHASNEQASSRSELPSRISLTSKSRRFAQRNFHDRVVHLRDLPRGIRLLALLGYANVAVLLVTLLVFELNGSKLGDVVAFDVDTSTPHEVPFVSVIGSLVAFIVGWSLVLTGASDCRRRVFLPVLGLFVLQMYLLTQVFGEVRWDSQGPVWWTVVIVATAVAGIHLFTRRFRYWRDLPLAEFCTWLLVLLVMLFLLLRLPKGELAERAFYLSFFGVFVTTPFWVVLGLEVVDFAVTVPRWFVLGPCRRLPRWLFHGLAVFVLAVQTVFASLVCIDAWGGRILDLPSSILPAGLSSWLDTSQPYVVYGCAFELFLILPLFLWAVVIVLRRRWTFRVATMLFVLSLAAPVITVGGSLALWGGKDFVEAGLSTPNVIPPFLLFAMLLAYDVLNFGVKFANSGSPSVPRNARVLMYFGAVGLVLSVALINVDEHSPITERPTGLMEFYVDLLFAIGVLLLGPPYLVWIVWKRRDWLLGDDTSTPAARPVDAGVGESVERGPHGTLFAVVGGAVCAVLGYCVTIMAFAILWPNKGPVFLFDRLGMVWGAVVWTAVVLGVALALVLGVRYSGRGLSRNAVYALATATPVYAATGVFIAWLMLVYSTNNAQQSTQTVSSETFQPALWVTVDEAWKWQEGPAALHFSRGRDSWLSILNVRGVYDVTDQNSNKGAPRPDEIVAWLRDRPGLLITSEKKVSVAGVPGTQLDIEISSVPAHNSEVCSKPCFPLFRLDDNSPFWIWEGNRGQIVVLRRGTETVVIASQSPAKKFSQFAPESTKVLGTLEWRYLAPGDYTFERFDPPLSLRIQDGWDAYKHLPDWASLQGDAGAYLSFVNVERVYGPQTPNSAGVQAAPDDLAAWFARHRYLDVDNVKPERIGGVSGPTFEVVVPPLPRDYSADCGEACVPLFFLSDGEQMVFREGFVYRVSITNVSNETIVTVIQSRDDAFDEFLSRAERVLSTTTWGAASNRQQ